VSAALKKHLPSSDVPVNVPYHRHQSSCLWNKHDEVSSSHHFREYMQHKALCHPRLNCWGTASTEQNSAVQRLGATCIVCVNGAVILMIARVVSGSSGQFFCVLWRNITRNGVVLSVCLHVVSLKLLHEIGVHGIYSRGWRNPTCRPRELEIPTHPHR
jgi:hypothetical protein